MPRSKGEGTLGPSLKGCGICDFFEWLSEKIGPHRAYDFPQECKAAWADETWSLFLLISIAIHWLYPHHSAPALKMNGAAVLSAY